MKRHIKAALCCLAVVLLAFQGAALAKEGGGKSAFSDVKAGSWYEGTVTAMAASGWLKGYPDGTFRPEREISGAEFISVVARCAGLEEASAVQTGHWAAPLLQAALDAGWYDWDELPPTGEGYDKPISRALAVKIVMKALRPAEYGRYDYNGVSAQIGDFSALSGRYYDGVLAAYTVGVVTGDGAGNFRPQDSLSRAEACAIIQRAAAGGGSTPGENGSGQSTSGGSTPPLPPPAETVRGGVSENGWLQVKGVQLCNEAGEPVVLHGMSSHGIQWYGQYTSRQAIANTAASGANLFRVAMYTGEGGYLSNPAAVKEQTVRAVDNAIANDLYVILDWHILSDGNPMDHVAEAEAFFREMAKRYKDQPAVLYEICNEPNGGASWKKDIKPYAERIVAVIREESPKAVILIGSSTWSQDVDQCAADPVAGENLMYTCHFYAGTHGAWLRERIDNALKAGAPIFVSEWGTSAADGSGGVYLDESKVWLDFLDSRGISWANWSLCDKGETSAALQPGTGPAKKWTEQDLSPSGRFVFSRF